MERRGPGTLKDKEEPTQETEKEAKQVSAMSGRPSEGHKSRMRERQLRLVQQQGHRSPGKEHL